MSEKREKARSGGFDLLRLVGAYLVLWSHQYAIDGFLEPTVPHVGSPGALGVIIFFAVSGYLNCRSLFASRQPATFLLNRAARIYPALIVCVAACVVAGAFVTTAGLAAYLWPEAPLDRGSPLSFVLRNATLLGGLDHDLPGVFLDHPLRAVNGSLWTLPIEAWFYVLFAAAAAALRFNAAVIVAGAFALVAGAALALDAGGFDRAIEARYALRFAIAFGSGVCIALIERSRGLAAALGAVSALAALTVFRGNPQAAILIGAAGVCIAIDRLPWPSVFAPRLDISYGVYLYAFPVQQLLVGASEHFAVRLALATAITTLLGVLSAVLIERPALRWRRARQASPPRPEMSLRTR